MNLLWNKLKSSERYELTERRLENPEKTKNYALKECTGPPKSELLRHALARHDGRSFRLGHFSARQKEVTVSREHGHHELMTGEWKQIIHSDW
jgi:hypothetical protein